jgi:hypothetical protein
MKAMNEALRAFKLTSALQSFIEAGALLRQGDAGVEEVLAEEAISWRNHSRDSRQLTTAAAR